MNVIKKYLWLVYPIGVAVAIVVSIGVLFGAQGLWAKMAQSGQQVEEEAITAANLRTKQARLQAVDMQVEGQNFGYLVSILPAQKNFPVLLAQISVAASSSGIILESFKGQVGEVAASESATSSATTDIRQLQLSLTFVGTFDQLRQMISQLESSLPLVEVKKVVFSENRAEMIVKGDWGYLEKLAAGAQYQVPDISADLLRLKNQLRGYSYLPPTTNQLPDVGVKDQPF